MEGIIAIGGLSLSIREGYLSAIGFLGTCRICYSTFILLFRGVGCEAFRTVSIVSCISFLSSLKPFVFV